MDQNDEVEVEVTAFAVELSTITHSLFFPTPCQLSSLFPSKLLSTDRKYLSGRFQITTDSLLDAMVRSECESIDGKLKFAFDVYDLDGSGFIDTSDLKQSLQV